MFYIVLNFKRLIISLQPDVQLRWGFDQNVAFKMANWIQLKIQIDYCRHVTHSPWSWHILQFQFSLLWVLSVPLFITLSCLSAPFPQVLYYSTLLFVSAGVPEDLATYVTLSTGCVMVVMTIVTVSLLGGLLGEGVGETDKGGRPIRVMGCMRTWVT